MKQKDITLIIIIVFVSSILSFGISTILLSPPKNRQQKVEVVEPITADFPKPDSKYFNAQSIDPTKLIQIGDTSNPQPFNTR